ncbi:hypothetical protein [Kitasatospora sp. NBC_00458]|uniref:hypothetical protein n=1 Tax=Kitasatospora sp. NBC_00458 TaxID=2903568 RepID=UPI002E17C913
MIELLHNIDLLTRRHLDLSTLEVGGIAFGAPASGISRRRVVRADSPIVVRSTNRNGELKSYDSDGRLVTADEILDAALRSDGSLALADRIGCKIRGGAVVGFSIDKALLSPFDGISSYEELLSVLGEPDQVTTHDEPGGPPYLYFNRYWDSQKCVVWDDWDHVVPFANLGDLEGNRRP